MSVRNVFVNLANQVFGLLGLSHGGTNADLSATGGTSQVLKQVSAGAAVTVGQLAASDLSNGVTGTGAVALANSAALTGVPTGPTPATSDNSTKLATTAYVQAQTAVAVGADSLNVNGSVVLTPFSITALVNGVGPVGVVESNGFVLRNNFPCLSEPQQNLSLTGNTSGNSIRQVGVIYQNPYSTPRLVCIAVRNNSTANPVWQVVSDANPVPTTILYRVTGANKTSNHQLIVFFVMPGNFYQLTTVTAGTLNLPGWSEYQLTTGTFADSGDIHASRALSTVFRNTTGNVMFVSVQITGVSASNVVQARSDTINPPPPTTSVVDDATNQSSVTSVCTSFFIVPPGHYYEVTAASGSMAIWHEYTWAVPIVKSTDLISTGGFGPTRVVAASGQNANTGTTTPTNNVQQIPCWLNNSGRVRIIVTMTHNSTAGSDSIMSSGPSIYPVQYRSICTASSSNLSRRNMLVCMPWEFYAFFDSTSGTLTGEHWWEYDLG